jgi:hypothetical protein
MVFVIIRRVISVIMEMISFNKCKRVLVTWIKSYLKAPSVQAQSTNENAACKSETRFGHLN